MKSCKVFCIGFQKTGTTSLCRALEYLDYKVTGPNFIFDHYTPLALNDSSLSKLIKNNDAFQDNPWPFLYKRLDENYPGSKFIYTYRRDVNAWYKSVANHFGTAEATPMRMSIYGFYDPRKSPEIVKRTYMQHQEDVFNYFYKNKNFLPVALEDGFNWAVLCSFLNEPVPNIDFPHANNMQSRIEKGMSLRGKLSKLKNRVRLVVGK